MNLILDNNIFFISSIFIIGYLMVNLKLTKEDYLFTKNQFNSLKGICAILIVIHHISQTISNNILLLPFEEIGKYMVAIFFMLSGYGVMISFMKNKNYLDRFILNRFIKVYIPFAITNIIFIFIKILCYENIVFKEVIYNIFGIKLIDFTMWFVITLIVLNMVFYMLFKNLSIKNSINILFIFILVYFYVCFKLGSSGYKLNSILSFGVGVVLAYKNIEFRERIKRNYKLNLIILFILCFIFRIFAFLVPSVFGNLVLLNISTTLFSISIITLGVKLKFENKMISFLGVISFEIYLLHMKAIYLFPNLNKNIISFIAFIVVLIGGSYLLNKLNKFISIGCNNIYNYYKK